MMIRPATYADIEKLMDHEARHTAESGQDGDVIFHPMEELKPRDRLDYEAQKAKDWSTDVGQGKWERDWVVVSNDGERILGRLTLQALFGGMPTAKHRANLMMGLQREARGQGAGRRLLQAAKDWAVQQPVLEYLQLFVFENNPRAKRLYESFGFKEAGTVHDLFRLHGQKISDTTMVLALRGD